MSLYTVGTPDFIVIHLKEIQVEDSLKIGQLSKIDLPNRLITAREGKNKLNSNILPLTLEEKHYGFYLQDQIKGEYLNKIIEKLESNLLLYPKDSKTPSFWEKDNKFIKITRFLDSSALMPCLEG
jgi:hypothetical protein